MLSAIRSAGDSAQDTAGPLHSRGVLPVSAVCTSVAKGHRDMWCESRAVALRLLTPRTPRTPRVVVTQLHSHRGRTTSGSPRAGDPEAASGGEGWSHQGEDIQGETRM